MTVKTIQKLVIGSIAGITLTLFSAIPVSYGADVVCFDAVSNQVTSYVRSVNTPDYSSNPNCLINPAIPNASQRDWKHDAGVLREMTQAEKDTRAATEAATAQAVADATWNATIDALKAQVDNPTDPSALLMREALAEVVDEIRNIKANTPRASRTDAQINTDVKNRLEALKV